MDQAKRDKIIELAKSVNKLRDEYLKLCVRNTPSDPQQREMAYVEVCLSEAELWEAEETLKEAINSK